MTPLARPFPARRSAVALGALVLGALAAACGGADGAPRATAVGDAETVADSAVGAAASAEPELLPAPAPRPASARDVVLVTIDTLRADTLGYAGNRDVETPWLDRLATVGRAYTRAYAHNVVTLPSHANILTGLYPPQHGVRENSGFVLRPEVPTLATRLRQAGYATGAFVGAFPLDRRFGLAGGFEVYDDRYGAAASDAFRFAERRGDEVVESALGWWRANADRPRFLWAHLYDPHAPYAAPAAIAERYPGEPYLAEVAATDGFLEPLLAPFLAGRESPALVIVTADHGEALGEHGELTHGLYAYEPTLAVPLVIFGAGVSPGRDDRLAGHVDLVPTVLARLGLPVPPELPGRSLLAAASEPRALYFEALSAFFNRGWAPLRGVVTASRWKAIELPLPELYDLDQDPIEAVNLLADERRRYHQAVGELPAESWPPDVDRRVSDEEARRLASLGYLSGSSERRDSYGPDDDPKRLVVLDRLLHDSIAAYEAGDMGKAESLAREIVAQRPQMAMGWSHLAAVLRRAERPGEALAVLEEAARRGATNDTLLRQLGLTLAESGRGAKAVLVLQPLVDAAGPEAGTAVDAVDVETLEAYGIALSDAGRHDEAAAALLRALELDPTSAKALETLGAVRLRQRRPAEAAEVLERAVELGPTQAIAWNSLGVARAMLGREALAVEAWQRSLGLDERQLDALYNLGMTAARIGQREVAREALERYVSLAPQGAAADVARAKSVLGGLG